LGEKKQSDEGKWFWGVTEGKENSGGTKEKARKKGNYNQAEKNLRR